MQIATLVDVLERPHLAAERLQGWGVRDSVRAQQTLVELAESGLTLDLLAGMCKQLAEHLPQTADPDIALAAFRRYFFAVRSPLALAAMLQRDPSAMPMLLGALALGPRWAELLVADPEGFDLLHQTGGEPLSRETLRGDVLTEVSAFSDERQTVTAIARTYERHALRIAYSELVGRQPLDVVMGQLSIVAETLVEAALRAAQKKAAETRSLPERTAPAPIRCTVLALGKLGAQEMDYASPLELMVIYDAAARDAAGLHVIHDHFDRLANLLVRYLTASHNGRPIYDVRLIPLPDSPWIAAAHAAEDVAIGFDSLGRTWHRQTMLKARPVAGDLELGSAILARLDTWLFRRNLNAPDETGIRALKRRILTKATLHQDDWRDVRLGRGALRDIEATVAFLQLLVGGDQPAVRCRSTLEAIAALEAAGTISADERQVLQEGYVFLQSLAHRLQVVVGLEASELPADEATIQQIAANLYGPTSAADLVADLQSRLDRIWPTLLMLLDSAFAEDPPSPREVDLLLDPAPPAEEVRAALAPFGFAQPEQALATLNALAAEQVPFLSTRRCRHLLASILPRLLCAIAATPNPDRTLDNLARVSDSLGGKGVLWQLLAASQPSLQLYVRLCAASPYLSNILLTNPGMIDELVDSLELDKLPSRTELETTLAELCRGAPDMMPVLHDFKNAQHLRIGVREILGKEDIDRTHHSLADVAVLCMGLLAELEYDRLTERFGVPTIGLGSLDGKQCGLAILALGKLGGRELTYSSHLDVLLLYEEEGTTRPAGRARRERIANNYFFTQLFQRIMNAAGQLTPKGRLYGIETPLRPIGVGGALALSVDDFAQHFASGAAPLWQWQALCQARPMFGDVALVQNVERLTRQLLLERRWNDADRDELRHSRLALEQGASPHNLKRAPGGTLDGEFVVQMLQLQHAAAAPDILTTNTQDALTRLVAAGILPSDVASQLSDSHRFLRRVQSALRLMDTSARHDLPSDPQNLHQLALLLGHSNPDRLREQCLTHMAETRAAFMRLTE